MALMTREELFDQNVRLHTEADAMLSETELGKMIYEAGYEPVGSYVMGTMTWRDLDFERTEEPPDWQRHWSLGTKLAQNIWIWRLACIDGYRDPRSPEGDFGFYWGLRLDYPKGGPIWKLDLWTARLTEFASGWQKRAAWMDKLSDETRFHILAIKNAVWDSPEYGNSLLSVHIYEAVLDDNIRGLKEFREWWEERYRK